MVHRATVSWLPTPISVSSLPPPSDAVLQACPVLSAAVQGRLSTKTIDRLSYARDMWPLAMLWIRQGKIPPPPDAIVWPSTDDEVAALIAIARAKKLAVIPFGAGSGVCGGTWAVRGGVTIDLKRFDAIGRVDPARLCVDAGAGVLGETLERQLNAQGYTLGHFPSSIGMSTVGGWLAARSAGQLSSKYGKIEDMVLSARVVLGTGEQLETPERPFSGADLLPLLIGSEGTLCVFTSARLRVFPLPASRVFHAFEFSSLETGLEAIRLIFREGLRPAVVRLYDPFDTAFVGKGTPGVHKAVVPPSKRSPFEQTWLPKVLQAVSRETLGRPTLMNQLQRVFRRSRLIVMFEGDALRAEAEDRAATAICQRLSANDLGDGPGRAWLAKRYDVSFRMSRLIESGTFADTMEIAAAWEDVQRVYEAVHHAASPFAFVLCHFSHAYLDGCSLYFSFVGSGEDEADMQARYEQLWKAALPAAMAAGGNVSHHHGVGLLKAEALQASLGDGRFALSALKAVLDPDHVLNPGKLGQQPDRPARRSMTAPQPIPATFTPGSAREVAQALHALADAGARLHREAQLDRSKLAALGHPHPASMTVQVGAGVKLLELDHHLRPKGLTVGPLSPAAMQLSVAEFLEGPYAGLRAIPMGRLEPICTRVEGVLHDGRLVQTPLAPRSAAGPDLSALFFGAHGRLGVVTGATLRCLPVPDSDVRATFSFASVGAFLTALRRVLAEGMVPLRVHVDTRAGRVLTQLRWSGSFGAVERDRELLLRAVDDAGGRAAGDEEREAPVAVEHEATWDQVRLALERPTTLQLFRLSLASVIARGDVAGVPLDAPSAWSSLGGRLLALDPNAVFGGAP